jgi:PAS domain S-box-containing protein
MHKNRIFTWLKGRQIEVLSVLIFALAFGVAAFVYEATESLVRAVIADNAALQAKSVSKFRNFYADEIVPRARQAGMDIHHDFRGRPNTLPLPATLTIELGPYLSEADRGIQVRLYSNKPFAWRQGQRQLDAFQTEALAFLEQNPSQTFIKVEEIKGESILRYAQADKMQANCVACHNSHADSPKTDWKVGDVRGVLEVDLPIKSFSSAAESVVTRTLVIFSLLLLAGLVAVFYITKRLKQALIESDQLSQQLKLSNQELTQEVLERKTVEDDLRMSESKLSAIFNAVPEAIIVANQRGIVMQTNPACEFMFGYTESEILGQNIRMLMPKEVSVEHDAYLERYIETQQKHIIDRPRVVTAKRKDGSLFTLRLEVTEMKIADQQFFLGVLHDYTAINNYQNLLIQAKDKAEQANKARGEFLAHMSHEIRTPMNGILGMTELAIQASVDAERQEYLGMAKDSAQHLLRIINDILDFSKIEAGALNLELAPLSIEELGKQTIRSLSNLVGGKDLKLIYRSSSTLPAWINADAVRLRQILTNLIGNAIKFTEVGSVSLELSAQAIEGQPDFSQITLQVIDTGKGFDADKTELLFAPFTQEDGSISRAYGGTGLGLAITRSLVRVMGGTVSAQSQMGQGSCFTVSFPAEVVQAPAQSHSAATGSLQNDAVLPADTDASHQNLSILLAEDHPVNQKLAVFMLQKLGHRCKVVNNGHEVLKALESEHFDLILMDVMMPGMDGLEALDHIRQLEAQGAQRSWVLMLTAHAMVGDRERFLSAGADGYVSKPMQIEQLQREMARVRASKP